MGLSEANPDYGNDYIYFYFILSILLTASLS